MKRGIEAGQIDPTKAKSFSPTKVAELQEAYRRLNKKLDDIAPMVRKADALKARQAAVAPFRTVGKRGLMGLTLSGTGAVLQSGAIAGAAGNVTANVIQRLAKKRKEGKK